MRWSALLLALGLAACADAGPPAALRLEALGTDRFRFTAPADATHPVTDSQAEHWRRRALERHLAERRLCPNGYRIDSRVALDRQAGIVRPVGVGTYEVVYEGSCSG